jgi:hypothetical protein
MCDQELQGPVEKGSVLVRFFALDAMRDLLRFVVDLLRSLAEPAARVLGDRLMGRVEAVVPAEMPGEDEVVDEPTVVVPAVMPSMVSMAVMSAMTAAAAVPAMDRDFLVPDLLRDFDVFVDWTFIVYVLSRGFADSDVFPDFLSGLLFDLAPAAGWRREREAGVDAVLRGVDMRVAVRGKRQRHERPGRHRRADISE